jgi:hypothetical protein
MDAKFPWPLESRLWSSYLWYRVILPKFRRNILPPSSGGGATFFLNVGYHLKDYTMSETRKLQSEELLKFLYGTVILESWPSFSQWKNSLLWRPKVHIRNLQNPTLDPGMIKFSIVYIFTIFNIILRSKSSSSWRSFLNLHPNGCTHCLFFH